MHDHKHAVDWAAIVPHMVGRQALEAPQQRQLIAWLGIKPGMVVADVGCGAGGMTALLAEAVGTPGLVIAVDGEPAMQEATKALAESCGVAEWVKVLGGDLEHEDLRTIVGRTVDLVHASAVVHHLADEVDGLRRLATALRPGGRLVVLEGGLDTRHLPADCGIGRPGLEGRITEAQKHWFWSAVRPPELQARPGAPTGWNDKLLAAGLQDVEVHSLVLEVPPPLPARVRETVRHGFVEGQRRFGHLLDREDNETLAVLIDEHDPRGVLHRSDVFVLGVRTAFVGRRSA
jgi:SAM-dependent methyltransferase